MTTNAITRNGMGNREPSDIYIYIYKYISKNNKNKDIDIYIFLMEMHVETFGKLKLFSEHL